MGKPLSIKKMGNILLVISKIIKDQVMATITISNINTKDNFIMIYHMVKDKLTIKKIAPSLLD